MRARILFGFVIAALATSAFAANLALVEPASGTVLRGGDFATVSWRALRPFEAEEWEAFLSVNGGRYYSVRLTPHLDIARRSFTFIVPNVASDDVRLLIRTGDERNETIIEFPQRFTIRSSGALQRAEPPQTGAPPEAARPGDAPVVQWSTGDHTEFASGTSPSITAVTHATNSTIVASAHTTLTPSTDSHKRATAFGSARICIRTRPVIARDVLRLTTRLNV